ncbi:hypothetical protein ACFOYW_08970 [Gryllotalpicola reticulitermitis]|uniref:Glycosyl transferase family 28 C-terminal domain-containing protein n=1 Tax=Gryllotalpicola reticulitermitis TaxID=1184153 RepID=A0ABV8Q578_9MICO
MKTVVVRCDGTPEGGLGHLVRGISVADAARQAGWSALIAGDVTSPFGRRLVADASVEVVPVPRGRGELVTRYGADVVHVDDYDEDGDALQEVRRSGAVLSSMEDGPFGRRTADVAIDSTIDAESTHRPADGSSILLRGIEFAPMREGIRRARQQRDEAPVAPTEGGIEVVVVLGGSDATGSAAVVAAVCARTAGVRSVTVVAPTSGWDGVRAAAGPSVHLVEPSADFPALAAAAQLVVSAASTTAWELACIGVPAVVIPVVDNQFIGYEAMLRRGLARGIGTIREVRDDPERATQKLGAHVAELIGGSSWAAAGRDVVDGLGAQRIVRSWELLRGRHWAG